MSRARLAAVLVYGPALVAAVATANWLLGACIFVAGHITRRIGDRVSCLRVAVIMTWVYLAGSALLGAGNVGSVVGDVLRAQFGSVGWVVVAVTSLLLLPPMCGVSYSEAMRAAWLRWRPSSPPPARELKLPNRLPLSLLDPPSLRPNLEIERPALDRKGAQLTRKLGEFKVSGRVTRIVMGPVVTLYEFEPGNGIRVSAIEKLAEDLTMALAADKVRVVRVPGKACVGFELPSRVRQEIHLRDVLVSRQWVSAPGALPLSLGKDTQGRPVFSDLTLMPHLLLAGATGSGKSVTLTAMILSLLMRCAPDGLRLVMIDPKLVELAVFDGIPHMLAPVVTDMTQAARVLQWAVEEMERRYKTFATAKVRDIDAYRAKGGSMPRVVVVVEEFADLMAAAPNDVEAQLGRLAQKARSAGVHLILATQRPSADVITGTVKANFPGRVACKVAQYEDSKTIIGRSGAERLLGNGDALCLLPGTSDPLRVHGCFVSEQEVQRICDALRASGTPEYDAYLAGAEPDASASVADGKDGQDLGERAVEVVRAAGFCSTTFLQRKLGIGYGKAANIVERLERDGIVGPAVNGGRREVFPRIEGM